MDPSVNNQRQAEEGALGHFEARTKPHSEAELERINELVERYKRSHPGAASLITDEYGPLRRMTFAEQYRQRLLGALPWVHVIDAGDGESITLVETRFCLVL